MNKHKLTKAELALLELIYRNPIRGDGDTYEMSLALWGLGYGERPNPADYGQQAISVSDAFRYAQSQGETRWWDNVPSVPGEATDI